MGQKEVKVTWTASARKNVRQIFDFLAQKSEAAATRETEKIIRKTDILKAGHLHAGQKEELLQNKKSEYRYLLQDHFKIIYRVLPEQAIISAVFDTRQNPQSLSEKVE